MTSLIESLKRLFVKQNNKQNNLKCPLCSKILSSSDEFDGHMKTDHK
jgi:hypothetical protein